MHTFNFIEFGRVFIPIYIKPFDELTLLDTDFKVDTGADKQLYQNTHYTDWVMI